MTRRRRFARAVLATAAGAAMARMGPVWAQGAPNRPLSLKVAFPVGGPVDSIVRQLQPGMQSSLGRTVIVENLPGAGGAIGAMNVVTGPNDGSSLLAITGMDLVLAPLSQASAKYDPAQMKMVGVLATADFVLVSGTAHAFGNVDELIAFAKNPANKELTIGHWGNGSSPHLLSTDFQNRAGIRLLDVPYKGVGAVVPELMGNQIDLSFMPLAGPVPGMIRTGKLRPIGVASATRSPYFPDLPTLNEGKVLKDFRYEIWSALLAPQRTPPGVVEQLNRAMQDTVRSAEYQRFLVDTASRPLEAMNAAAAQSFLETEVNKIMRVARTMKIEAQ